MFKILIQTIAWAFLTFPIFLNAEEFIDASEAVYRTILKEAPTQDAGPAALRMNEPKKGRIKVEIISPVLPNLSLGNRVHIKVDAVLDSAGNNILAKKINGGMKMHSTVENTAVGSFSLSLAEGANAERYTLKGSLTFMLPVNIEVVDIKATQIGQQVAAAGGDIQLTFLEIKRKNIKLEVVGPKDNILLVEAFNAKGQEIERVYGGVANKHKKVEHHIRYSEDPTSIRVYVAKSLVVEQYPFEVKKS